MKIFLIGTSRSGSNMLRVMLNVAQSIDAPHPPFFMEKLRPFQHGFGDLSNDANYRRLIDAACRLIETNHVHWDWPIDREQVFKSCVSRSTIGVAYTLMDLSAQHQGKSSWLCKASGNVHFLPEIQENFPDARYLHLVRDGRDVAVSYLKAVVGEKTAYHIARQWAEEQRLCRDLGQSVGQERYLCVRYEDILTDTENQLRRICDWLKLDFDPAMLNFHESHEAMKTSKRGALWTNLEKPLISDNMNKWEKELSPEQILVFESVAAEMLDHYGYERKLAGKSAPLLEFSDSDRKYFVKINRAMKQHALSHVSDRDKEIRRPQDELLCEFMRQCPDLAEMHFPTGSVVIHMWRKVMQEIYGEEAGHIIDQEEERA